MDSIFTWRICNNTADNNNLDLYTESRKTSQDSFSAVSKWIFWTKSSKVLVTGILVKPLSRKDPQQFGLPVYRCTGVGIYRYIPASAAELSDPLDCDPRVQFKMSSRRTSNSVTSSRHNLAAPLPNRTMKLATYQIAAYRRSSDFFENH